MWWAALYAAKSLINDDTKPTINKIGALIPKLNKACLAERTSVPFISG